MKTHRVIVMLAALTTLAVFPTSEARGGTTNLVIQPRIVGQQVHVDITKWDVNKDGHLDSAELRAFRREMLLQRSANFKAQRQAAIEMRRAQLERQGIPRIVPPAVLQQYDANQNGVLDPDEWARYLADQSLKQGKTYEFGSRFGLDARIVTPPTKPAAR